MDPVDQFAKLKAAIQVLEAQADALRLTFLRPGARLRSNQYEVVIRKQTRRTFNKALLPDDILDNPRYWSESQCEVVTVRQLENSAGSRASGRDSSFGTRA